VGTPTIFRFKLQRHFDAAIIGFRTYSTLCVLSGRLQGHRNSAGLQGKFAALQNSHLHPGSPFQSRPLSLSLRCQPGL